jgi:hypothetical protein
MLPATPWGDAAYHATVLLAKLRQAANEANTPAESALAIGLAEIVRRVAVRVRRFVAG